MIEVEGDSLRAQVFTLRADHSGFDVGEEITRGVSVRSQKAKVKSTER
jgi:hypothetical protein